MLLHHTGNRLKWYYCLIELLQQNVGTNLSKHDSLKSSVNFKSEFWCLQIYQQTNEILIYIPALAAKNWLNQKIKALYCTKEIVVSNATILIIDCCLFWLPVPYRGWARVSPNQRQSMFRMLHHSTISLSLGVIWHNKVPLFFWFDQSLEARAEVLQKIWLTFGRLEDTKFSFWD